MSKILRMAAVCSCGLAWDMPTIAGVPSAKHERMITLHTEANPGHAAEVELYEPCVDGWHNDPEGAEDGQA